MDITKIIEEYNNGKSINAIARTFKTYPTTIKRILEKNNVELRHDAVKKGTHLINDGEKLLEWAKAQGRLVTRAELAAILGKTRISNVYFERYPELGQYIAIYEQNELSEYANKLHDWLQKNDISFKPNDKTALNGPRVSVLLLEQYANIALQIDIKPKCVSKKQYINMKNQKITNAKKAKIKIIFLKKEHFKDLNCIKDLLKK